MPPQPPAEPSSSGPPPSGLGTPPPSLPSVDSRVMPPHPANAKKITALHVRKLCTGKVSFVIVLLPRREMRSQADRIIRNAKDNRTAHCVGGTIEKIFADFPALNEKQVRAVIAF